MLHTETFGEGPELVLVHGWGMHAGIWQDWATVLGQWFHVTSVDLPGHGYSDWSGNCELQDWAQAVHEVVPADAWWVGWSLGGLVALSVTAAHPEDMRGLVLLAGTPKFVASSDWPHAIETGVLEQFARQLEKDPGRTLLRFLSLQLQGSDGGADQLRRLRAVMKLRPTAHPEALRAGLQFLRQADLRAVMRQAAIPMHWILGDRDTLIPPSVSAEFPGIARLHIRGAGHAPFLSHPEIATRTLCDWLQDTAGAERANG